MSTTEVPKKESIDLFAPYKDEITRLQRQIKGYKGREAKLSREQAPYTHSEAVPSQPEAGLREIKSETPHFVRPWEQFCTGKDGCGGAPNPNYVKPNVHCSTCNVPLGTITRDDIQEKDGKKIITKIEKCWNCGSPKVKVSGVE